MFVALPALIVWGLGIPFMALVLIFRNRKVLDSVESRTCYGFLYRGYKHKFYFWEIMIMYRKIALILISVFVVKEGVMV